MKGTKPLVAAGSILLLTACLAITTAGTAVGVNPQRPSPAVGKPAGPSDEARTSALARANNAVKEHRRELRASGADVFKARPGPLVDRDGTAHVRYDRTYSGLPVLGGDSVVHVQADGTLLSVTQTLDEPISVSTSAAITKAAAESVGRAQSTGRIESVSSALVVDALGGQPVLAYDVLITGKKTDETPSRLHVIVDAASGQIVRSADEIMDASGESIYSGTVNFVSTLATGGRSSVDPTYGNSATDVSNVSAAKEVPGTLFVDTDDIWGNGTNSDRASAAVDAIYGANLSHSYFKNVHGRDGIWGDGRGVRSRVHYGTNYANAFWDGTQITYGDGSTGAKPFTSIDVAAHEYMHGITENVSGLSYAYEGAALHEALSDIFSVDVEFYANNPNDVPDYFLGEKIDYNGNGTPTRYFDKPSRDVKSFDCYPGNFDSVIDRFASAHSAGGPARLAWFLMAEGSEPKTINGTVYDGYTCITTTVNGIGRDVATKIWYRALSTYFTSGTRYSSARSAVINAAADLYGKNSTQCATAQAAWDAVTVPGITCADATGTGGGGGGTTPPPAPANLVANPSFESGTASWTAPTGVVRSDTGGARTGAYFARLNGRGTSNSQTLSQKLTIPTATSASLSFYLRITSAETSTSARDTLRVQVVDGSTTTTLATYSNANKNTAYDVRTLNLTAYAGKTVILQFVGTENAGLATDFKLDDLSLTTS